MKIEESARPNKDSPYQGAVYYTAFFSILPRLHRRAPLGYGVKSARHS
jgi:hypothetical protein